jgi:Protein of unknown function (DUF3551)
MRTTAVAAILYAALSLCSNGAQAAPWCAHYNTGLNDCGFYSFPQCMAAVSGVGGSCSPNSFENPYRTGSDARRRYRRDY